MSEHSDQAAFIDYVISVYKARADFSPRLFFAVPNGAMLGGRVPALQMEKLKREGVQPGVADLLYLQPRGKWAYLAIEMKTAERKSEKRGGLTDAQREWLLAAGQCGARAVVCWGLDDAIETFDDYMREDAIHE